MGITANNVYQKPNTQIKYSLKTILKVFINKKASTATSEENWFLPAAEIPPVPQSIQSEAEFIDQDQIFVSKRSQRVNSAKELNDKTSAELLRRCTEPQRSTKAPTELKYLCKTFNTEYTHVSFFIEPPKGQEAIKSVLIVIGDLLSDLTSSFFYIYFCRRWVRGWLLFDHQL